MLGAKFAVFFAKNPPMTTFIVVGGSMNFVFAKSTPTAINGNNSKKKKVCHPRHADNPPHHSSGRGVSACARPGMREGLPGKWAYPAHLPSPLPTPLQKMGVYV